MSRQRRNRLANLFNRAGSFEPLENRQLLAGNTLQLSGTGGDENFRVRLDSTGTIVQVWDDNNTTRGGPVSSMALSGLEAIYFTGGSGNDRLTVDSTNGLFNLPGGIHYDGGAGYDDLVIAQTGGPVRETDTYSPGPSNGGGKSVITDHGQTQTIIFDNLEPVLDTVAAASLRVTGTNADNAINYMKGSVAANGLVSIDNFETIEFSNKTSLILDGLAGDDTFNLRNLFFTPTALTNISVLGGDPTASDTLIVNGLGNDPGTKDTLRYTPFDTGQGRVTNDTASQPVVNFQSIEHLKLVGTSSEGDRFRIDGTAGDDTWEFTPGADASTGTFTGTMDVDDPSPVTKTFALVETTIIGASPDDNAIEINRTSAAGTDRLIVNGLAGDDSFIVSLGDNDGTDVRDTRGNILSPGVNVAHFEVFDVDSIRLRGGGGTNNFFVGAEAPLLDGGLTLEGGASASNSLVYVGTGGNDVSIASLVGPIGFISEMNRTQVTFLNIGIVTVDPKDAAVSFLSIAYDTQITATGSMGNSYSVVCISQGISCSFETKGAIKIINFNSLGTSLKVVGESGVLNNLSYQPTAASAGTVVDGSALTPLIEFSGVSDLSFVEQAADGDGVVFDGTAGNDSLEFFTGATVGSGTFRGLMDQNNTTGAGPFEMTPLSFRGTNPLVNDLDVNQNSTGGIDSFTFNATASDDSIDMRTGGGNALQITNTIGGVQFARLEVFNVNSARLRGSDGDDMFTIDAAAPTLAGGIAIEGGNPSASDALVFTGTGTHAVTLSLDEQFIREATRTNYTFTGIEFVDVVAGANTFSLVGGVGHDSLAINARVGGWELNDDASIRVRATALALSVDGGGGDNSATFSGTSGIDAVTLAGSSPTSGTLTLNALSAIDYSNLQHVTVDGGNGGDAMTFIGDAQDATFIGGAGADTFNLKGDAGNLKILGGSGADTVSFASATEQVIVNLDQLGVAQRVTTSAATVTFLDSLESFTGSNFNDILRVSAAAFHRDLNGGPQAANPPGDTLIFDGAGRVVTTSKVDFNTGTIRAAGLADADYDQFETLQFINTPSSGGFDNGRAYDTAHVYKLIASPVSAKGPSAIGTGDFNNDGFQDYIVVNSKTRNLAVMINKGDGTFNDPVLISAGGVDPRDIVVGNFDATPGLDLVVSLPGSSAIAFFQGNNNGTFATPVQTKTKNFKPFSLAVGDMNSNGNLDVVALSESNSKVQVLFGDGAGGFATSTPVKTGAGGSSDVQVGDFNNDGHLDVVTANSNSKSISFFSGSPSGALSAATLFKVGSKPTEIAVGDINGDGSLDLAVSNKDSSFASVLLSNGSSPGAQFQPQLRVAVPGVHRSTSVVLADVNGDGTLDLALGNASSTTLTILLGTGGAKFTQPFEFGLGGVVRNRDTQRIAVADFNNDGLPDFVTNSFNFNDTSVLIRNV